MPRNRASAKAAGTRAESAVVNYLRGELDDDRIERRAKSGAKDRGDVSGVRIHGQRLVIEVKDVSRLALSEWVNEATVEAANDDALAGVVWAKKRGTTNPGDWYVVMTGADFVAFLSGSRTDSTRSAAISRPETEK